MGRGAQLIAVAILVVASSATAAPRLAKGPYLQNLAPRSMTVMWQLDPPTAARLDVAGPGSPATDQHLDVAPARVGEATITGLAPATRYRYQLVVGDQVWKGEFATAPEVGKDVPFSFAVLGDTRENALSHRRVIDRLAREVPDFVLGTGDMVDDGAKQEQWQTFFDVERELLRDNVYFPSVGNHDRQGRGRTADSYRGYFAVPDNGGESGRYYAFTYASGRFLVLDSNLYSFSLTDQTAWIERELMAARQDPGIRHIFVVMHHPPFSISLHGGQRDLRERWTPLFEKYGVSAVFSGHDHVYERAEKNGLHYFVSGGGGAPLYPRRPRPDPIDAAAVLRFERVFHYLRVSVSGNRVEVTGVRVDGTTIETTTWTDGPAQVKAEAAPAIAAAGAAPVAPAAPAPSIQPAPPKASASGDGGGLPIGWLGLGGAAAVLLAAVVLVRTLRPSS